MIGYGRRAFDARAANPARLARGKEDRNLCDAAEMADRA